MCFFKSFLSKVEKNNIITFSDEIISLSLWEFSIKDGAFKSISSKIFRQKWASNYLSYVSI